MARLPRLYVPGLPQLILQRGNNGADIFTDEQDFLQYRTFLREAAQDSGVAIHAYVMMPNHVHILGSIPESGAAGAMMQRLGRRYVRWFNDRHFRSGTLWEGRYRATVLEPERWLLGASLYIEANPVRQGFVSSAFMYPWSSCRHHIGLEQDSLITDHPLYWALGNTPFERQAGYRHQLDTGLTLAQIDQIRYAQNNGWMLGKLPEQMAAAEASRRLTPLPKGRPKKVVRTDIP